MSRNKIACCPSCSGRIPVKKFLLLNNFSVANCGICNARIEISNRTANAIIAIVSGIVSAASIVLCSYLGVRDYNSLLGGLLSGIALASLIMILLFSYIYRHARLNRITLE